MMDRMVTLDECLTARAADFVFWWVRMTGLRSAVLLTATVSFVSAAGTAWAVLSRAYWLIIVPLALLLLLYRPSRRSRFPESAPLYHACLAVLGIQSATSFASGLIGGYPNWTDLLAAITALGFPVGSVGLCGDG